MSETLLVFNGIDGATGRYLLPPLTAHQVSGLAQGYGIDDAQRQELRARHLQLEPSYAVKEGVDPNDLAQTGWGVVFPHGADPSIKDALGELLALRREQAGDRFRVFEGADAVRPGETKDDFLRRHGMGPGPADPDRVPYYLLLVGDPDAIPFRFQYQLDVQYAVGRIHFDTVEEYAHYARSVVTAERGDVRRARTAVFFGVRNEGDAATAMSAADLVAPLAARLGERFGGGTSPWRTLLVEPRDAGKSRLLGLLGGAETPALLFTASHGLAFSPEDPRQVAQQGALICAEWPGPEPPRPIGRAAYLAADDIDADARPLGMIAFHFACYGAGTPRLDDFAHLAGGGQPGAIARRPFVAALPRRLLGHPRGGALAVIGHVERAWGCSIRWGEAGAQIEAFRSALHRLLGGHRVGSALEPINGRYAEISTDLGIALDDIRFGKRPDDEMLAWMWTANNDARAYAVVGDPAVRLAVGDEEAIPDLATTAPATVSLPLVARRADPAAGGRPSLASVVHQVARVIGLVERLAARPAGATIARVELTVQAIVERGAGGEVTLSVPVRGRDGSADDHVELRAVSMAMRPAAPRPTADTSSANDDAELAAAILRLCDAVRGVAASPPGIEVESATVELRFALTGEGRIALVSGSEPAGAPAHTLTLHLAESAC